MACPHEVGCTLFAEFAVSSLAEIWKIRFCRKAFDRCARFDLAAQGKQVPARLLPDGSRMLTLDPSPIALPDR